MTKEESEAVHAESAADTTAIARPSHAACAASAALSSIRRARSATLSASPAIKRRRRSSRGSCCSSVASPKSCCTPSVGSGQRRGAPARMGSSKPRSLEPPGSPLAAGTYESNARAPAAPIGGSSRTGASRPPARSRAPAWAAHTRAGVRLGGLKDASRAARDAMWIWRARVRGDGSAKKCFGPFARDFGLWLRQQALSPSRCRGTSLRGR